LTLVGEVGLRSEEAEKRPVGRRALAWRTLEEGGCRSQSELAHGEGLATVAVSLELKGRGDGG
jgi:hypothetical protein